MSNSVIFTFKALDKFTGVSKKISRAGEKIASKMKNISKQSDIAQKKTSSFTNSFKGRLKGLAVATASFAAGFASVRKVISEGAKFQDSLADLSSITGAAGKDLEFFKKQAFEIAKAGNVMQSDVVGAITDIASAKSELLKDPKGLVKITEQAILLSNAAGIDLPSAVQASVGALNQFGEGADQASRFVNVLAAGSKVGAARVSDVVESMKNAGSVASQFNVSFEETNALIQVLAKNGIKGAEAGTAIRGTLSKLEKIANGKLAPSKIGILKSLKLLESAQLSNTQIIKEFGEENLRSILILRKNIPLIKQWTGELTGTNVAQEQADKRLSTFNSKVKKLGITLNESLIKTFLKLEPVLTDQVEKFTEFLEGIKPEQIEQFSKVIGILAKGIAALGRFISFVAKQLVRVGELIGEIVAAVVTLDFGNFSKSFSEIGKGISDDLSSLFGFNVNSFLTDGFEKLLGSPSDSDLGLNSSTTDINVKLVAPEGTIESIKSKTTGKSQGLNVGVNMASAL